MRVLLDIDDTALISKDKGKTWFEHSKLDLLIKSYDVFLYSGNPEIASYHRKWKTKGFYAKGSDTIPKADILIDNDADLWKELVDVKKTYKSIDSFLRSQKKS